MRGVSSNLHNRYSNVGKLGFLDNAAALHELELAVSAKNLNIGVLQLTMDFGMVCWIFMAIIVFLHLPTKYSSRELILLISTVEPMAAMELRKIFQDEF